MANDSHYDCVVIGSGQGGKPLAEALNNLFSSIEE